MSGMFDGLLKVMGEYGNPVPRFTGQRCIVERMAVGGCDACVTACPHEAITVGRTIEIDEKACTGCGLCVQACPTGALEYDVTAVLGAVREQGAEAKISCAPSGEGGKSLPCLGRLTPSAVIAAGAWDTELTLVHGDCAACNVGSPEVPARLQGVIDEAQRLREATGRPARVSVRRAQGGGRGEAVNRRGMFGSMFRSARGVVAEMIPESPLPFVDWSVPQERVPAEWVWRRRALRPAPPVEAHVAWTAPRVGENCNFCPVCSNVCPTEAIRREQAPDGSVQLQLNLAACTGCDACVKSCPPAVMTLADDWTIGDFDAPVVLADSGGPV